MLWLRIFWWIFWRSLVSSILVSTVLGALMYGVEGAKLGALVGTELGLMVSTLNVPLVAAMTRLYVHRPSEYARYIWSARIGMMVVDCIPVLLFSLALFRFGILSLLPPILTIIAIYYLSLIYIKFVDAHLPKLTQRKPKLTIPL